MLQYLFYFKQHTAQNDGPTPIHRASIFIDIPFTATFSNARFYEGMNRIQTTSPSHCETRPGKVQRSNTSDWSIFDRKPEQKSIIEVLAANILMRVSILKIDCECILPWQENWPKTVNAKLPEF